MSTDENANGGVVPDNMNIDANENNTESNANGTDLNHNHPSPNNTSNNASNDDNQSATENNAASNPSSNANPSASTSNANKEHLNLKVKAQDGTEVYFKVKKTTKLKKLMDAYCARVGKEAGSIRFLFDGDRIAPNNTPALLGMEDEDEIDAMVEVMLLFFVCF